MVLPLSSATCFKSHLVIGLTGLEFSCQHPHGALKLSVTSVIGDRVPSFDLWATSRACMYVCIVHFCAFRQNIHTHKLKIVLNKLFFKAPDLKFQIVPLIFQDTKYPLISGVCLLFYSIFVNNQL